MRWRQPDGTLVVPGDFLPPIENSDAMHDLTLTVLDQSIGQLAHWRSQGLEVGSVAVNVPSQSLLSPDFQREVHTVLERYHVGPGEPDARADRGEHRRPARPRGRPDRGAA